MNYTDVAAFDTYDKSQKMKNMWLKVVFYNVYDFDFSFSNMVFVCLFF